MRAPMEIGVNHKACTSREVADLSFEILQFIKVARPVHIAMLCSSASIERYGVAQAFTELCKVKFLSVVLAILVAGSTTHVCIFAHLQTLRVVKNLFSEQHRSIHGFLFNGRDFFQL